jgi:hypothetical protein
MSKNKISKREKQIMDTMGLDYESTKAVTEIGRLAGTNKYDVWIGREISKNKEFLLRASDFQFIIDWAKKDKPDIFRLNFEDALQLSKKWHDNLKSTGKYRIFEDDKDEERIIYKSKNGKYFFMLLNYKELQMEGDIMKNCVGSYTDKIIRGKSLIVSMRDMKNEPHVTIEIDIKTNTVTQVKGKANTNPSEEYMKVITEFAIYASGFDKEVDEDISYLINLKF